MQARPFLRASQPLLTPRDKAPPSLKLFSLWLWKYPHTASTLPNISKFFAVSGPQAQPTVP